MNQFDMQTLMFEWNKELEISILPRQWGRGVNINTENFNRSQITSYSIKKYYFRLIGLPLLLHRKGQSKSSCWGCNEINASFKHTWVHYPVIAPFGEELTTCINSTLRWDLIWSDVHILFNYIPMPWKLTSGQKPSFSMPSLVLKWLFFSTEI